MRCIFVLPCLIVLAACNPSNTTTDLSPGTSGGADAVSSLVGEYRVAGIDGAPLDVPFGLVLSVSQDRILFDGPCGGYGWDYRMERQQLRTDRTASPTPACLAAARIHHVVFDLAVAVDAATSASRDSSNAVILSGGGHQVTLYSQ